MSRLLAPPLLLVVWLALWGGITVVNVVSGLLVVAVLGLVIRRMPGPTHRLHPLGLLRLFVVFGWRLVTSSATVVATVLAPTPTRLRSGIVGVELSQPSQLVAAIVSDAISLTPGTLTLDVRYAAAGPAGTEPPTLYVHVLGLSDPAAIRADVRRLESLVLAAITPDVADGSGASATIATAGTGDEGVDA